MFSTLAILLVASALVAGILLAARRSVQRLRARIDRDARHLRELGERIAAAERQKAIDLEILDGLGEGILALDRDRRVALANHRFLRLFAIEGSVIGKSLGEVVRISALFDGVDRAFGGEESTEQFAVRVGGVERRIEMRARRIAAGEIAVVAVFIDVTRIERLEQIRRDFVSDFSHEVRTPLAGLRSAVETYENQRHLAPGEEEQLRRIILRQLRRLERLVDDLAELTRIESGEIAIERRPVELRHLIDEVCEDFAERAAQHRVRFSVCGGPAVVSADPVRMEQALSNLIDNAIKYGGDGHEVRIEVCDAPDSGSVRITDEGVGVPVAERENIFRRFYRVDKSRSQEISGAGLGLAITKHLVLRQGGSILVEGREGEGGATFVVTLPKM